MAEQRVERRRHTAALAVLVLAVAATFWAQFSGPVAVPTLTRSGDTAAVVEGAAVAADCLREGTFTSCGEPGPPLQLESFELPTTKVGRYATLPYLPAIAVDLLGFRREVALVLFGLLNAVAFVLLAALPWLMRRRLPGLHRMRLLWAAFIGCGLLVPYGVGTWSECLAAALTVGVVAGVAARWPRWAVALLAFAAGLSKDPMFIFVALLAFAVADGAGLRQRVRAVVPVLAGSAAAVADNAVFNVFRYGSVRNVTHTSPVLQVRGVGNVARQLVALMVSPNGGVVVFWPLAVVVLAVAVLAFVAGDRDTRLRLGVVAITTGGFFLGLAVWYSPFGWHAWGPRLSIPILPAAALAVFVVAGARMTAPPAVWAGAAVAVVLSAPNVAMLGAQYEVSSFMTAPSTCRARASLPDPFVDCVVDKAWSRPWLIDDVVTAGLGSPPVATLAVVDVGAGLVLAAAGFQRAKRVGRVSRSAPPAP